MNNAAMIPEYAKVIVDIATAEVDRMFDYYIPGALQGKVLPGMRVSVPFGPREIEGVVLELANDSVLPRERIKPVHRTLDLVPSLLPCMLELAVWVGQEYHVPLAHGLRLMLPSEMRRERVQEKHRFFASLAVPREDAQAFVKDTKAKRQALLMEALLRRPGSVLATEVLRETGCDHGVLRRLEELGLVAVTQEKVERRPMVVADAAHRSPFTPTAEQSRAIAAIEAGLARHQGKFLLFGVTGSGKTEVYMQCAQKAMEAGQGVIMLVPEIALTPQMIARFTARFGDGVAVLHSKLSPGERHDEWQRIRNGEARMVIGARSAVFAPVENLGLLVVDEEHEESYRSDSTPRYDAVEVAKRRCEREGATLVLGSATPSVCRYYQAEGGEYRILNLFQRIGAQIMPKVEIVDMREELTRGNRSVFSGALAESLDQCLKKGEQAILFLNRRGHSHFVSCRACGFVCKCEQCDLSMTWHQADNTLHCHYCGLTQKAPQTCPQCGSGYIRYFGGGTQKVEEEFMKRFPEAKMLRMDADTTRTKDAHTKLLEVFRKQEAQVLIGTQMIAKGLDFPMVTLVGIMAADLSLHVPDYRNAERTFQLIAQVSGRAGRAERPGKVVLQTYSPDHFSIQTAAIHDYQGFYDEEILRRRLGDFAPHGRFMRVLVTHENPEAALKDAAFVRDKTKAWLAQNPSVAEDVLHMEDGEAPVNKIQGRYRAQLLVKTREFEDIRLLENAMADILKTGMPRGSSTVLEINPSSMI